MQKRILIIILYTVFVVGLIASVKWVQNRDGSSQPHEAILVASCSDPAPGPSPGE